MTLLVLTAVVGIGAWLRLTHLDEMEYKRDERWSYTHATRIPAEEPWPSVGMPSGIHVPNAALSLLVFVGLAHLAPPSTPVDLARSVALLNVAALVLLFLYARFGVATPERANWQWASAFAAVNPFAVILERKIWAQSTLPIFSALFLVGWSSRHRWWGAMLWGLLTAALGQIHMSGIFFGAAFCGWARYAESSRTHPLTARWRWFLTGFAVGAVGLVGWFAQIATAALSWMRAPPSSSAAMVEPTTAWAATLPSPHLASLWPSFWWNWASDAAGFGLQYSLGADYAEFLRSPVVAGHSTWLAMAATAVSLACTIRVGAPWAVRQIVRLRRGGVPALVHTCSDTVFTEGAAVGIFGLLLTATIHTIHRHYLLVAFPLQWVWLARVTLPLPRGRILLTTMWIAQLSLSVAFLYFIHTHHGAPRGDYGTAFRWQVARPAGE